MQNLIVKWKHAGQEAMKVGFARAQAVRGEGGETEIKSLVRSDCMTHRRRHSPCHGWQGVLDGWTMYFIERLTLKSSAFPEDTYSEIQC